MKKLVNFIKGFITDITGREYKRERDEEKDARIEAETNAENLETQVKTISTDLTQAQDLAREKSQDYHIEKGEAARAKKALEETQAKLKTTQAKLEARTLDFFKERYGTKKLSAVVISSDGELLYVHINPKDRKVFGDELTGSYMSIIDPEIYEVLTEKFNEKNRTISNEVLFFQREVSLKTKKKDRDYIVEIQPLTAYGAVALVIKKPARNFFQRQYTIKISSPLDIDYVNSIEFTEKLGSFLTSSYRLFEIRFTRKFKRELRKHSQQFLDNIAAFEERVEKAEDYEDYEAAIDGFKSDQEEVITFAQPEAIERLVKYQLGFYINHKAFASRGTPPRRFVFKTVPKEIKPLFIEAGFSDEYFRKPEKQKEQKDYDKALEQCVSRFRRRVLGYANEN